MFEINTSIRDSNGRTEGVERVGQKKVIRRDKTPFVFFDVIDFAAHVVVTSDHINLVLNKEGLVADTQLVHMMQGFPAL